jgi:protein-tyrosine phosphatase
MSGLVLYAVDVSGGNLAISALPGAGGSYASDLALIHDWRPALVLSLTESKEMQAVGAEDLGPALGAMGCRWVHLPIPDFDVPSEQVLASWSTVSETARKALAGGGRVLVHCRGGCGRSGMIALRLMIEAGEPPETALARLRAVRPCAVETDAQLVWATKGALSSAANGPMS